MAPTANGPISASSTGTAPGSQGEKTFSGSLVTKTKAELQELGEALHLSLADSMKKTDMVESIESHLSKNADNLKKSKTFKGLYGRRKTGGASPEASQTPEALDAVKSAGEAARKTYDEQVQPTATHAAKQVKTGIQKAKEMVASMDAKDIPLPESPRRSIRKAAEDAQDLAQQAIDAAGPAAANVHKQLVHAQKKGLQMWRRTGRKEVGLAIRQGQEYMSNSRTLVGTIVFLELVVLLYHLIPVHHFELFAWVPEHTTKIYYPEPFALFNLKNDTLVGVISWIVFTILPPFALSHLISFMPQPNYASSRRSGKANNQAPPLPTSDPLVFAFTRLAILLFPLTNAAPDVWINTMEKLGSLQGRALFAGLTAAYVLAERLGGDYD